MELKTFALTFGSAAIALSCATTGKISNPPVGQHPHELHKKITKTVTCKYLLFLPADYYKSKKRWPLILFLHGAGERGDNLELVKKHGPPKIVEHKPDFPFIVLSPQCPAGQWWSPETLLPLLDDVIAHYRVDTDRIYLTGLSMGGFGTWDLAVAAPDRFAAIAPICGRGNPFLAPRIKDIPVWVFHGAKDQVVPIKESEDMINALKKLGADVKFTVYPNANHDAWTETYNNPKLYEWFLQHKLSDRKKK